MEYTIHSRPLSVRVSDLGAELQSIFSAASGHEYLWQGLPEYWSDRAPTLFPYIGRLTQGAYTFGGKRYQMSIHGIAPYSRFTATHQAPESITLELTDSADTLSQYPFRFRLQVAYTLAGDGLEARYTVENRDSVPMYFAIGGHPGIRVPLDDETAFEDWTLRFPEARDAMRVGFSPDCFVNGKDAPFPLAHGTDLPLRHDLFDDDAIVLRGMGSAAVLCSARSGRSVRMDFDGFPCFGIWHWPRKDAPYVCLEPWSSLPSRSGILEDLASQPDLLSLAPGQSLQRRWALRIDDGAC